MRILSAFMICAFLILGLSPAVTAATLTVSQGSASPGSSAELAGTSGIVMLQLHAAASGGVTIRVTRVTVHAQG
ncbi:MAG: hypothetical protein ACYTHM_24025, partial [Planctomycetota bacterium]